MSRYAIWNKQSAIITPVGEVFTADEWIAKHPVAGVPSITVVCGGGEINGSFFGTLGQMIDVYTKYGCDFSACKSDEEKLIVIEEFEDLMNSKPTTASNEEITATSLASIAASLEFQNMMALDDVEV